MATTTVSIEVDEAVLAKAADDLAMGGLTVAEAVNIFLRRIANEQVEPEEFVEDREAYDAWVRAKVQEALDNPGETMGHEEFMAEMDAYLEGKRNAAA